MACRARKSIVPIVDFPLPEAPTRNTRARIDDDRKGRKSEVAEQRVAELYVLEFDPPASFAGNAAGERCSFAHHERVV